MNDTRFDDGWPASQGGRWIERSPKHTPPYVASVELLKAQYDEELRALKHRLEATLERPKGMIAVPVEVDDVRRMIRLVTLELIGRS